MHVYVGLLWIKTLSFLSTVNYVLEFCDSTVEHLYGRQEQKLHSAVYKKKELRDLIWINPACSLVRIEKHVHKHQSVKGEILEVPTEQI